MTIARAHGSDWKRPRRIRLGSPEYAALRDLVFATTGGRCIVRACGRRAESAHHLVGGSDRSDVAANLVPLCGDGVRGCHGALTSANRVADHPVTPAEVRAGIRARLTPAHVEHVIETKSEAWLDRFYPSAPPASTTRGETK